MDSIHGRKTSEAGDSVPITLSETGQTEAEAAPDGGHAEAPTTFPDASPITDLISQILILIQAFKTVVTANSTSDKVSRAHRLRLGDCYTNLNLWSDVLRDGHLETALGVVPDLRQTILENLSKIGRELVKGLYMTRRLTHFQTDSNFE
jgi:hypothetical protein